MFPKIPTKFHDKTVQSYILWLNLNKIGAISILQSAPNKVNPHFTFMRRAQNADTHALKQPRLSQNISPVCFSFVLVIASDMYLESESEKRAKHVDLQTAQISRYNQHFFVIIIFFFYVWPGGRGGFRRRTLESLRGACVVRLQ